MNYYSQEKFTDDLYNKYYADVYFLLKCQLSEKKIKKAMIAIFSEICKNYYNLDKKNEDEIRNWIIRVTLQHIKRRNRLKRSLYKNSMNLKGNKLSKSSNSEIAHIAYDLAQKEFIDYVEVMLDAEQLQLYELKYKSNLSSGEIAKYLGVSYFAAVKNIRILDKNIEECKTSFGRRIIDND